MSVPGRLHSAAYGSVLAEMLSACMYARSLLLSRVAVAHRSL